MKKDLSKKKLTLHRETLQSLATDQVARVRGGTPRASCKTNTATCPA